jgi:hypothetical protein
MLKIKNHEIEQFASFLLTLELKGKQSRMRTRLCKILAERLKQVEEERMDLIEMYSDKDDNGKPKVVVDQGRSVYSLNDKVAFDNEYRTLLEEEFIVSGEENREIIDEVKEVVLNVDMSFKGEKALIFDRWCEILEGM